MCPSSMALTTCAKEMLRSIIRCKACSFHSIQTLDLFHADVGGASWRAAAFNRIAAKLLSPLAVGKGTNEFVDQRCGPAPGNGAGASSVLTGWT